MMPTPVPGPLIAALYGSAGFVGFGLLICLVALWSRVRIQGIAWLAVMCAAAIGYQLTSVSFHLSTDLTAAFAAKRWQNIYALIQVYTLIGFITVHMRLRNQRKLLLFMGLLIGAMLILALRMAPDEHFSAQYQLSLMHFPWGEQLSAIQGEISLRTLIGRLVLITILSWSLFRAIIKHAAEDRLAALIIGLGLIFLMASVVFGILIESALLDFVYPGGFGYIAFVTMALYLIVRELKVSQKQLSHTSAALLHEQGQHQQAQQEVEHLSYNDPLTNLPSRAGLFRLIEETIASSQQETTVFAMLHIDIDRFDVINDTLGPHLGDQLLRHSSQRIRNLLQEPDFVARINADEFICIIHGPVVAATAGQLATAIHDVLRAPFEIDSHTLHITASIGIALFPDDAKTAHDLLVCADLATREAKRLGRNRTEIFHHELNSAIHERMDLGNALRVALAQRQFELYFQPQVEADGGALIGLEALIRWNRPENGMISPDRFIPLAEEMRLIEAIGAWVIDETCRILALWRDAGMPDVRISINLSTQQLRQNDLIDIVCTALERHQISGAALEFEITESMVMDDQSLCIAQLQRLKALGISLAIDDFGTGYSSLAYLKRLPIDTLKIDRVFVRDIDTNPNDKAICAATISMAQALGLNTVAEGVETNTQALLLRKLGCQRFQGYFYARPIPVNVVAEFIHTYTPAHEELLPVN